MPEGKTFKSGCLLTEPRGKCFHQTTMATRTNSFKNTYADFAADADPPPRHGETAKQGVGRCLQNRLQDPGQLRLCFAIG